MSLGFFIALPTKLVIYAVLLLPFLAEQHFVHAPFFLPSALVGSVVRLPPSLICGFVITPPLVVIIGIHASQLFTGY